MSKQLTVAELIEQLKDCNPEDLVTLTKTGINIYTVDNVEKECN